MGPSSTDWSARSEIKGARECVGNDHILPPTAAFRAGDKTAVPICRGEGRAAARLRTHPAFRSQPQGDPTLRGGVVLKRLVEGRGTGPNQRLLEFGSVSMSA